MNWGGEVRSTGGSRSQRRICSPLFSYVEVNKGLLIPWLQVRVLRGSLPCASLVCKVQAKGNAGSRAAGGINQRRPCDYCLIWSLSSNAMTSASGILYGLVRPGPAL